MFFKSSSWTFVIASRCFGKLRAPKLVKSGLSQDSWDCVKASGRDATPHPNTKKKWCFWVAFLESKDSLCRCCFQHVFLECVSLIFEIVDFRWCSIIFYCVRWVEATMSFFLRWKKPAGFSKAKGSEVAAPWRGRTMKTNLACWQRSVRNYAQICP